MVERQLPKLYVAGSIPAARSRFFRSTSSFCGPFCKICCYHVLELRDRAKKSLGPKFDLKAFHDEVLDSGALPLDVLEQRVNDWIASQK